VIAGHSGGPASAKPCLHWKIRQGGGGAKNRGGPVAGTHPTPRPPPCSPVGPANRIAGGLGSLQNQRLEMAQGGLAGPRSATTARLLIPVLANDQDLRSPQPGGLPHLGEAPAPRPADPPARTLLPGTGSPSAPAAIWKFSKFLLERGWRDVAAATPYQAMQHSHGTQPPSCRHDHHQPCPAPTSNGTTLTVASAATLFPLRRARLRALPASTRGIG